MFGKGNTWAGKVSAVIHPVVSDEDINAWNLTVGVSKKQSQNPIISQQIDVSSHSHNFFPLLKSYFKFVSQSETDERTNQPHSLTLINSRCTSFPLNPLYV